MRIRKDTLHASNPELLTAGRRRIAMVAAIIIIAVLAVGGWFVVQQVC